VNIVYLKGDENEKRKKYEERISLFSIVENESQLIIEEMKIKVQENLRLS
jgi:hypothetical protein